MLLHTVTSCFTITDCNIPFHETTPTYTTPTEIVHILLHTHLYHNNENQLHNNGSMAPKDSGNHHVWLLCLIKAVLRKIRWRSTMDIQTQPGPRGINTRYQQKSLTGFPGSKLFLCSENDLEAALMLVKSISSIWSENDGDVLDLWLHLKGTEIHYQQSRGRSIKTKVLQCNFFNNCDVGPIRPPYFRVTQEILPKILSSDCCWRSHIRM